MLAIEQSSIQVSDLPASAQTTTPRAAPARKLAPWGLDRASSARRARSSTKMNSQGWMFRDDGDRRGSLLQDLDVFGLDGPVFIFPDAPACPHPTLIPFASGILSSIGSNDPFQL
jgi:hypothetical protein